MQSLITELLSTTEAAFLITTYLATAIACTVIFIFLGSWIGRPVGGLIMQLVSSIMPELPEPQRAPQISRGLGVLCSFSFFFLGLIAEGIKLPHPESMTGDDYAGWFLKAAIIGIEVSLAANGVVLVVGKLRRWVAGGEKKEEFGFKRGIAA
jgi:hypothetical protein